MASTETSFADRLQRGRQLHSIIASFDPDFAPADADLAPAKFLEFLDGLAARNVAMLEAGAGWRDTVAARLDAVKDIKTRALRTLSLVKSHKDWTRQIPAVKSAADSLRGYRPSRLKNPPKDNGTAAVTTRSKANQSFGDVKNLLDKLIAALGKVDGYDTAAPEDLTIEALTALSSALDSQNQTVAGHEQDLRAARDPRRAEYETLKQRKKAIKDTARAQYGGKSAQFLQAKTVRV